MRFSPMVAKVRSDPMGPLTLEQLRANVAYLRGLVGNEHIQSTGEHNAWEVPRVCRQVSNTGVVSPSSTDISSVSHPATGKFVLTLAGSRFSTDIRCQVNPIMSDTKPHVASVNVVSATSVEVYTAHLTTALGTAGNAWAAVDCGFDIAIHSDPLDGGAFNPLPAMRLRGDNLDDTYGTTATWNALVQEEAELYRILTSAHTSAGVHNVRETARRSGLVRYSAAGGGSYVADTSFTSDFSALTRLSAGVCQVDFASLTTPTSGFASHDYLRGTSGSPSSLYVYSVVPISATRVWVYIFQYTPGDDKWNPADTDFYLVVHGS